MRAPVPRRLSLRLAALLGLLGLLWSLASPEGCAACTCGREQPLAEDVAQSSAVFRAHVVGVSRSPWSFFSNRRVRLLVNTSWKGPTTREIVVTTAADDGMCGFNFEVGEEYLVYAGGGGWDGLYVSSCSRTRTTTEAASDLAATGADEDLAALGPGTPVIGPPPGAFAYLRPWLPPILAGAVIAAFVAALRLARRTRLGAR